MIREYTCVSQLPDAWDDIAGDNIYLTREFMAFMEKADDTEKKYYAVFSDDQTDTVFMTVRQPRFNLTMFTERDYFVPITLVYVPLSVTKPGIAYGKCLQEAMDFVRKIKGYKLFLNLPDLPPQGYAKGYTCPKCVLDIRWDSLDGYLQALRSNYRYRCNKALKKAAPLTFRFLKNGSEFTPELYRMYETVYNKSRVRVEKLTERFFRDDRFVIMVAEENGVPRGFVQLLGVGSELVFEFVGLDYGVNEQYDTYLAMLLQIIRYGCEHGFKTIDFGQTADDTKRKLGCRYEYLYAYLHHSNPIINALCKRRAPVLQCKPLAQTFSVFKESDSKEKKE